MCGVKLHVSPILGEISLNFRKELVWFLVHKILIYEYFLLKKLVKSDLVFVK